jgi:hypothetical protein
VPIIRFETYNAEVQYEGKQTFEEAEADARRQCEADNGVWQGAGDGSTQPGLTVWTWATHVGMCVSEREMNGRDDSDFYMTVYIPEKDTFESKLFATTRGWSYPGFGSHVDATPEVKARYEAHLNAIENARRAEASRIEAATPRKGKTLKVVKGRKVPVGTEGECVWYGAGKQYSRWGGTQWRVGLKTSDGTVHWTDAANVLVVAA